MPLATVWPQERILLFIKSYLHDASYLSELKTNKVVSFDLPTVAWLPGGSGRNWCTCGSQLSARCYHSLHLPQHPLSAPLLENTFLMSTLLISWSKYFYSDLHLPSVTMEDPAKRAILFLCLFFFLKRCFLSTFGQLAWLPRSTEYHKWQQEPTSYPRMNIFNLPGRNWGSARFNSKCRTEHPV